MEILAEDAKPVGIEQVNLSVTFLGRIASMRFHDSLIFHWIHLLQPLFVIEP